MADLLWAREQERRGAGGTTATERRDMRARAESLGSRMTAPLRFRSSFRFLVPSSRPTSWEDGPTSQLTERPTSGTGTVIKTITNAARGTCFTLLARSLDRLFTSRAPRSQGGCATSHLDPLSLPNLLPTHYTVANIIAVNSSLVNVSLCLLLVNFFGEKVCLYKDETLPPSLQK